MGKPSRPSHPRASLNADSSTPSTELDAKGGTSWLGLVKYIVAIGFLVYLVRSDKLSMSDLEVFLKDPYHASLAAVLLLVGYLVSFLRWKLFLRGVGVELSYFRCLRLGMLGQFFSTVMPSVVGGDVVKGVYVAREFPSQRVRTLSTILLDRVTGLIGLLFVGGVAFWFQPSPQAAVADPKMLLVWNWGFLLGLFVFIWMLALVVFSFFGKRLPSQLPGILTGLPGARILNSLYDVLKAFRDRPRYLWYGFLLSILNQGMNVFALSLVANSIFGASPWGELHLPMFFVMSAFGMVVMSLPISPGGWGVAQWVFGEGFAILGAPAVGFGSSIITGYQLIALVLNLCGFGFFVTYRKEQKALEQMIDPEASST